MQIACGFGCCCLVGFCFSGCCGFLGQIPFVWGFVVVAVIVVFALACSWELRGISPPNLYTYSQSKASQSQSGGFGVCAPPVCLVIVLRLFVFTFGGGGSSLVLLREIEAPNSSDPPWLYISIYVWEPRPNFPTLFGSKTFYSLCLTPNEAKFRDKHLCTKICVCVFFFTFTWKSPCPWRKP